jgi:hypothetical protein
MAKKKKRTPKTEAERAAWDAHVDETIRELRDLAARGRAELGLPPVTDSVAHLRELAGKRPAPPPG